MQITRSHTNQRMSQIVVHADTVYLAGQVAADASVGVTGQTSQILERIDALLREAGTDRSRILSASIWLSDITTFDQMNSAWDAWVPEGDAPARACVEARLARPELLVEISVVAAR
jgi:enamine deaminase RidA (YjgF/YER057c/UK114 family)